MFLSDIAKTKLNETGESAPVSLTDKSKSISALAMDQSKLFTESQQIAAEIDALGRQYLKDLKALTDKQGAIAEKAAAIDDALLKLVKI